MDESNLQVEPNVLISYLTSRRWQPVATWRGTTVWEQGPESDQLMLPDEPYSSSGRRLLHQALAELAATEERSPDRLLADLARPRVDVQRFRLQPHTPSGTIPLSHGRKAVEAIYRVLRDAGRNAIEGPRLYHKNKPVNAVQDFLDRVQLNLTLPGSYIFSTSIGERNSARERIKEYADNTGSPIPVLDEVVEVPSDHEIAVNLQSMVTKAHDVAEKLAEGVIISNPSDLGVSSNLCLAIAELGGESRDYPFEISFDWGFGHDNAPSSSSVPFTELMADCLHSFGKRLEQLARSGPALVEGKVIGLHTEDQLFRRRIQVKGIADREGEREDMTLWVFVSEQDYGRAIDAHRNGLRVQVEGRVTAERGGYRMYSDSSRFRLLSL
ncbi:hypothetical protein [Glycomyces sp. NPDC047010]|uniref:hypothetical protein n=1 Tax=Glycomyces sp. NPDC047010 TaxID=3155023 RepID=UPI0033EDC198